MTKNTCDWQSENDGGYSCNWQQGENHPPQQGNESTIHRFNGDFTWDGVETEAYNPSDSSTAGILRNIIIGNCGESCLFDVRYFEIAPGGHSSLGKHIHEHVVICVRGKGRAVAGINAFDLKFLDTLYIASNEPHQLICEGDEPFGFFCIVNSERDTPRELLEEELHWLQETVATKNLIRP